MVDAYELEGHAGQPETLDVAEGVALEFGFIFLFEGEESQSDQTDSQVAEEKYLTARES